MTHRRTWETRSLLYCADRFIFFEYVGTSTVKVVVFYPKEAFESQNFNFAEIRRYRLK